MLVFAGHIVRTITNHWCVSSRALYTPLSLIKSWRGKCCGIYGYAEVRSCYTQCTAVIIAWKARWSSSAKEEKKSQRILYLSGKVPMHSNEKNIGFLMEKYLTCLCTVSWLHRPLTVFVSGRFKPCLPAHASELGSPKHIVKAIKDYIYRDV